MATKKRITLTFPTGTIIFDTQFNCELDARCFKWILSPEVYHYWHAFAASPRPSNFYVVLSRNATELSTSGSSIAYNKILNYFKKQSFQVSMEDSKGPCPSSTFVPSPKLKLRLERMFIAHFLGVLLAAKQYKLFEDLFDACYKVICTSIKDRSRQYQAVAEIMLTATSPPICLNGGNPQITNTPSILRYLRVFDNCFRNKLSKIICLGAFKKNDQLILRQDLIQEWQFYRINMRPIRLDAEVNALNENISTHLQRYYLFIYLNLDQLSKLLCIYPKIVSELVCFGVIDTFVLWNELLEDSYYNGHTPVLTDFLPSKPFKKQLSPSGYQNIYNLIREDLTLQRDIPNFPTRMKTLVPFLRLYKLLSFTDDKCISLETAELFHKALNNNLVMTAMRGDLHDALQRNDIEKMLLKPIKSYGLTL